MSNNNNTMDFLNALAASAQPKPNGKARRTRKAATTEQAMVPGTDPLLAGMNSEQAEAIQHLTGPLCVLAGAGSGKTRVLIHRVAYLIRSGVPACRILAVTFSKNAADEMKERGKALGLDAEFRTWHSLALHIIKEDHTEWAEWTIDDKNRAQFLLKDVLGYRGMNWTQADLGQIVSYIGYCKSQLWHHDTDAALQYAQQCGLDEQLALEAYERYDAKLREERMLTFDDMLVFCVQHLNQSGVAERWAGHWDYVLQDEAQDACPAQLVIAKMLAYGHKNYMVVGDPAQSLYGFRGAAPKFIMGFVAEWCAKLVSMHRNYRCGKSIIDAANAVIRPSTQRLPTDIVAEGGWDGVVTWRQPNTLEDEGADVAGSIQEHVANGSAYADCVGYKCTCGLRERLNALSLSDAQAHRQVGHGASDSIVRNADDNGSSGNCDGVQSIDDRQGTSSGGQITGDETRRSSASTMEGWTPGDEERVRGSVGGTKHVSLRTSRSGGTNARSSTETRRSSSSSERRSHRQSSTESGDLLQQFRTHAHSASEVRSGSDAGIVQDDDLQGSGDSDGLQLFGRVCSNQTGGSSTPPRHKAGCPAAPSTYSDCCVLFRLNAQSRGIEEALLAAKIPYVVVGGCSFYERKEVRDLLAYLRLIAGRMVRDSLKRAINAPFRFLGAQYVEKALGCLNGGTTLSSATTAMVRACQMANVQQRQRSSVDGLCRILQQCERMAANGERPDAVLQHVLDATQYEAWLKRDSGEESLENSHVANVKEMVRVAGNFTTVVELLDFVDATIESAKKNAEDSKGRDRVVLMSIHKSKGLEFKHVHFVGACEMIIPHPRAEDLDEERRLAYVAITRAKQTLMVTSPRTIATKSGLRDVPPSRFVVEAGLTSDVQEDELDREDSQDPLDFNK